MGVAAAQTALGVIQGGRIRWSIKVTPYQSPSSRSSNDI